MASYCEARNNNGVWHLRIDDIDPPRAMPDATNHFQDTLSTYGFEWDGPVIHQSQRTLHYQQKLQQLNDIQLLFPCDCSRSRLAKEPVYPGYCSPVSAVAVRSPKASADIVRRKLSNGNKDYAIRIIIDSAVWFDDDIQGHQRFVDGQPGDTIVVRRDDLFAYALACALDDASGITHVVRGSDLLPTTASQLAIMSRLKLEPPRYAHIPVAVNSDAQKLSKQTKAQALDTMPALPTLLQAWQFLGQRHIAVNSVSAFWQAAFSTWQLSNVPKQSQLQSPV